MTGSAGRRWRKDAKGYMVGSMTGHPVAGRGGHVRLHRVVLWDRLGGARPRCEGCGVPLSWLVPAAHPYAVTVDHIDGDRANNDPTNLRPMCRACNARYRAREERARSRAQSGRDRYVSTPGGTNGSTPVEGVAP